MRTMQQTVYPELNVAPLPVTSQQSNAAGVFSYDEEIKEFTRSSFLWSHWPSNLCHQPHCFYADSIHCDSFDIKIRFLLHQIPNRTSSKQLPALWLWKCRHVWSCMAHKQHSQCSDGASVFYSNLDFWSLGSTTHLSLNLLGNIQYIYIYKKNSSFTHLYSNLSKTRNAAGNVT